MGLDHPENRQLNRNILDLTDGIICHQVNCQNKMGAGLALQIRKKWPQVYKDYISVDKMLGNIILTKINPNLVVASLCGQISYGRSKTHTNYIALYNCFTKLKKWKDQIMPIQNIFIPYQMGCGLAGGDWNTVKYIISNTVPDAIIVKLPN